MGYKALSSKVKMHNAAKTLLANIRFASVDNPVRSIVVTSSVPNEGKSTVAVALAEAIATSGKKVLMVDCDLRNRSLAGRLDVHAPGGIYAVLSEQMSLNQAVVPTRTPNLFLLDTEPGMPNPADILSSKRFRTMTSTLENNFDYVVYDTPPVAAFVDAAIIASIVDATVLVVREDFVKRDSLLNAYDQLNKAGAHIVGAVMNCCEASEREYYYAYYNQNGERDHVSLPVDTGIFVSEDVRRPAGKHDATSVPASRRGRR